MTGTVQDDHDEQGAWRSDQFIAGDPPDGPVGLVVAGASAWGAYEAGVLSVLLPVLEERGQRPTVLVGTRAGAINAVLFASLAHLPAPVAVDRALRVWRSVRRDMVLRPAWQTLPVAAGRYLARLAGLPVELRGLLDTTPLHQSLASEALIDWPQLHENVRGGVVRTVAVVTTELETNRRRCSSKALRTSSRTRRPPTTPERSTIRG